MSRLFNLLLSASFGVIWYALSQKFASPILDRVLQSYSDDFVTRFAALSVYVLGSLAVANAYVELAWAFRIMWLERKKTK